MRKDFFSDKESSLWKGTSRFPTVSWSEEPGDCERAEVDLCAGPVCATIDAPKDDAGKILLGVAIGFGLALLILG